MVKVDTEGHELAVLTGGKQCLATDKPHLMLESAWAKDTAPIEEILTPLGYSYYLIDDENFTVTKVADLSPSHGEGEKIDMDRLNRLATCMSETEVQEHAEAARKSLRF